MSPHLATSTSTSTADSAGARRLRRRTASVVLGALCLLTTILSAGPAAATDPGLGDPIAVDVPFEERDTIAASMIEFSGVANSANARWLVHLYQVVFARAADTGGLDHWLARIAAGGEDARHSVARSFLNSTEGARNEAVLAYRDLLNRNPDPAGLEFWTSFLRTGSVNALRFQHLASDEYFAVTGGTNEQYVKALYIELLGRSIDQPGFEFYVNLLDTGTPRWWVSRTIYQSPESLGNRVTAYHRAILGRAPTATEMAEGVALILAQDERAVQARLLSSDEAFESFLLAAVGS